MELSEKVICRILDIIEGYENKLETNVEANLQGVARTGDTPQKITGRNQYRTELWIHNDSDKDLFLGPSDDIDENRFSLRIAANDTLIMNTYNFDQLYKREIYGFWDTNPQDGSKAMVTEYYQTGKL